MSQPTLPWDSPTEDHPDLVWRAKMDDRYLIEVARTGERTAKLRIYDHAKGDAEIACWDVGLSYGAIFGPDVGDVAEWQDKVAAFIDDDYAKRPGS